MANLWYYMHVIRFHGSLLDVFMVHSLIVKQRMDYRIIGCFTQMSSSVTSQLRVGVFHGNMILHDGTSLFISKFFVLLYVLTSSRFM